MEQVNDVAYGISEFGMLVMTAAFFLVFSASMMMIFGKFFIKLINNIIEKQENSLTELLEETREQNSLLFDLSEGMRDENMTRIKILSGSLFDNSKEEVCRIIRRIREENHIDNREATAKKIRRLLQVVHDNRDSKLDNFVFRGKRLSAYTSERWVEQVALIVESELYNEAGVNNGRMFTNVSTAYEDIKIEFYQNIINSHENSK